MLNIQVIPFLLLVLFIKVLIVVPVQAQALDLELLSQLPLPGMVRDVVVDNGVAYIANSSGIVSIDVSNPADPIVLDSISTPGSSVELYLDPPWIYVADSDSGVSIIDISNPSSLIMVKNFKTLHSTVDLVERNNYLYIADDDSGFTVYDISDIDNPTLTFATSHYTTFPPSTSIDIDDDQPFVYLAMGNDFSFNIYSFSIEDPMNIFLIGISESIPCHIYEIDYWDNRLLAGAVGVCQTFFYDVSDPGDLFVVAVYGDTLEEQEVIGIHFDSSITTFYYTAIGEMGVQTVDIDSNTVNVFDTPGFAYDLYVAEPFVFVADSSALLILKELTTSVEENVFNNPLPSSAVLHQNYPNPFNNGTTIRFDLPYQGNLTVAIYNILGQKVRTLVNEQKGIGQFMVTWDGKDDKGIKLPSGVYFSCLTFGNTVLLKKIIKLR